MYGKLVIGVDGADGGRDATALAGALADAGAKLDLVHVRVLQGAAGHVAAFEVQRRAQSIEIVKCARDRDAPSASALSVLASTVGEGLHDAAESRGADLLVIGGCRRGTIGRVLAGDDARSTLRHAPCAVAVAPRGWTKRPGRPWRIGVAYDGSPGSDVALQHARSLAERLGGRVTALCLLNLGAYLPASSIPTDEELEALRAHARERLAGTGDIRVEVQVGSAGEGLVALSRRIDLLVCGSRRNGALKRVALGSTSEYLARHAACPLIVVPAPAHSARRAGAGADLGSGVACGSSPARRRPART